MLEADDYSALMHSVRRDVHWLRSCGLMDYSLIVGILHRYVWRHCVVAPKHEAKAKVRTVAQTYHQTAIRRQNPSSATVLRPLQGVFEISLALVTRILTLQHIL